MDEWGSEKCNLVGSVPAYCRVVGPDNPWYSRVEAHCTHMPRDRCFFHSQDTRLINSKDNSVMHLLVVSLGFFAGEMTDLSQ